jgi:hypothetical protein
LAAKAPKTTPKMSQKTSKNQWKNKAEINLTKNVKVTKKTRNSKGLQTRKPL